MIKIRRSQDRGFADHGWLKSFHTFSFADYYDEKFMHYRHLRVINEDRVESGFGFDTHPHSNMEIISYVVEGALEHKDSLGIGSVIKSGDVQVMSAGTGISHSEFNHSKHQKVHFLQIWIVPDTKGLKPTYQQKNFTERERLNRLCLVASNAPRDGALFINQDVHLFISTLEKKQTIIYATKENRYFWLQVIKGKLKVNTEALLPGDAVAVEKETKLEIHAEELSEFLLFDLS